MEKKRSNKGIKIILAGSLIGMGSFVHLPTAQATESTGTEQEKVKVESETVAEKAQPSLGG